MGNHSSYSNSNGINQCWMNIKLGFYYVWKSIKNFLTLISSLLHPAQLSSLFHLFSFHNKIAFFTQFSSSFKMKKDYTHIVQYWCEKGIRWAPIQWTFSQIWCGFVCFSTTLWMPMPNVSETCENTHRTKIFNWAIIMTCAVWLCHVCPFSTRLYHNLLC